MRRDRISHTSELFSKEGLERTPQKYYAGCDHHRRQQAQAEKIRIADEKAAARRSSYCILAFKKCAGGTRTPLRHFSLRFGTAFSGPPQYTEFLAR